METVLTDVSISVYVVTNKKQELALQECHC